MKLYHSSSLLLLQFGFGPRDHVILTPISLHWLPVRHRITYKPVHHDAFGHIQMRTVKHLRHPNSSSRLTWPSQPAFCSKVQPYVIPCTTLQSFICSNRSCCLELSFARGAMHSRSLNSSNTSKLNCFISHYSLPHLDTGER